MELLKFHADFEPNRATLEYASRMQLYNPKPARKLSTSAYREALQKPSNLLYALIHDLREPRVGTPTFYLPNVNIMVHNPYTSFVKEAHEEFHSLCYAINPALNEKWNGKMPDVSKNYIKSAVKEGLAEWGSVQLGFRFGDPTFNFGENESIPDYAWNRHLSLTDGWFDVRELVNEYGEDCDRLHQEYREGKPRPYDRRTSVDYLVHNKLGYFFATQVMQKLSLHGFTNQEALTLFLKNLPETIDTFARPVQFVDELLAA